MVGPLPLEPPPPATAAPFSRLPLLKSRALDANNGQSSVLLSPAHENTRLRYRFSQVIAPAAQRQGAQLCEPAERRGERNDLSALAAVPAESASRQRGVAWRHRGRRRFVQQSGEAVVGRPLGPRRKTQAIRHLRLCPGQSGPAVDRADCAALAPVRHSHGRSGGERGSHLAARRADRRLNAAGNPRPGVRVPPRHGPSRRGGWAAAGRRFPLVLARCSGGRF